LPIGTNRHLRFGGVQLGRSPRSVLVAALLFGLLAGLLPVAPARAAITQVGCGDATGLRDAVRAANARPGFDGIILKNCTYKFLSSEPFADAALVVTDDLAIYGNGADITRSSKAANMRHFDVTGAGTDLELNNITLAYGRVESPYASFPAAGSIVVGPGASLFGPKLTVEDNAVQAIAQSDSVVAAGGILNNGGTVRIEKGAVKRNTVSAAFGPGAGLGGGIATTAGGTTTVYKTVVKANEARTLGVQGAVVIGGGIATLGEPASLTVEAGTISDNLAVAEGGTVASGAGGLALAGTTTVSLSTVSDNEAKTKAVPIATLAGGILNRGALEVDAGSEDLYDRTEITENETFCPDDGCAARGGGYAQDSPAATALFRYTAVKDNAARAPEGAAFGGGLYVGAGTVELDEGIVKRNSVTGKPAEGGGIFAGPGVAVEIGVSDVVSNKPRDCYGVPYC
jgi:hypothetical protein